MNETELMKRLDEFLTINLGHDVTTFQSSIGRCRFRAEFERIESLGCTISFLACELNEPTHFSSDELVRRSEGLAHKLNYLVEPIRVIEIDKSEEQVQLRSDPPQQEEKTRSYFELNLTNQGLHLCRFEKTTGAPRQRIASVLTQEVLKRLAHDLIGAVS